MPLALVRRWHRCYVGAEVPPGRSVLELRHLRYYIAVAEEATIVAAAKRLRLAQPALTRQIHDLENEIGVPLFERDARGTHLTAAGEACLTTARHILHSVDVAIEEARGSSKGIVGRCVVCAGARSLASGLIARVVSETHAQYPSIELSVVEGAGPRQWHTVQVLDADIGLGLPPTTEYPDLSAETGHNDIFDSVVLSVDHPLASRESLSLFELKDDTFLFWQTRYANELNKHVRAEFRRIGFKPREQRDFDEIIAIATLITANKGWTFIPRRGDGLAPPNSVIIPLTDFRVLSPHCIITRKREHRPVVRTVVEVIRRCMVEEAQNGAQKPRPVTGPPVSRRSGGFRLEDVADRQIELRHLRYFMAVAEARSFGRAAERLELTQPALSRQIRDLEKTVGVELLDRDARGVRATAAGESFMRSARRIIEEAAAIPAEAERARRGVQSRCVIATVATTSARNVIAELLRRCEEELPALELSVQEFHTPQQPAELRAARVDLGLVNASPMTRVEERGLRRIRLLTDEVNCVLVAADGPLALKKELTFRELADIPFVFPSRNFQPGMYDQIFSAFEGQGFKPRVDSSYDGLRTIWTMVAEGRGWGIGFASQCNDPPFGTVAVPLRNLSVPWGLDVLARADESRTAILLVLDMLQDIAIAFEEAAQGT